VCMTGTHMIIALLLSFFSRSTSLEADLAQPKMYKVIQVTNGNDQNLGCGTTPNAGELLWNGTNWHCPTNSAGCVEIRATYVVKMLGYKTTVGTNGRIFYYDWGSGYGAFVEAEMCQQYQFSNLKLPLESDDKACYAQTPVSCSTKKNTCPSTVGCCESQGPIPIPEQQATCFIDFLQPNMASFVTPTSVSDDASSGCTQKDFGIDVPCSVFSSPSSTQTKQRNLYVKTNISIDPFLEVSVPIKMSDADQSISCRYFEDFELISDFDPWGQMLEIARWNPCPSPSLDRSPTPSLRGLFGLGQ